MEVQASLKWKALEGFLGLGFQGFRVYLDPQEPTFSRFWHGHGFSAPRLGLRSQDMTLK